MDIEPKHSFRWKLTGRDCHDETRKVGQEQDCALLMDWQSCWLTVG